MVAGRPCDGASVRESLTHRPGGTMPTAATGQYIRPQQTTTTAQSILELVSSKTLPKRLTAHASAACLRYSWSWSRDTNNIHMQPPCEMHITTHIGSNLDSRSCNLRPPTSSQSGALHPAQHLPNGPSSCCLLQLCRALPVTSLQLTVRLSGIADCIRPVTQVL